MAGLVAGAKGQAACGAGLDKPLILELIFSVSPCTCISNTSLAPPPLALQLLRRAVEKLSAMRLRQAFRAWAGAVELRREQQALLRRAVAQSVVSSIGPEPVNLWAQLYAVPCSLPIASRWGCGLPWCQRWQV